MWCPTCHAEYTAGFTRCTDCDVELVAAEPSSTPRPARVPKGSRPSGELVQVYRAPTTMEADIVRSILESSGIEVLIKGHELTGSYAELLSPGGIPLLVRPEDADAAREIIEAAQAGEFELEAEE